MTTGSSVWAGYRDHKPLFENLVRREVRQRYKGSVLGLLWTLINPLIMVGVYSLVFRILFRFDDPTLSPYGLFLFVGITAWTFFAGGVQAATSSLIANGHLVTKVAFPREIVPVSAMTANGFTAGTMLLVALPLCIFFQKGSLLPLVMLPLLIFLLIILTIGLGLLLAGLNVYFRDTEYIYAALTLPWFFLSPIFYTYDVLPVSQWILDVLHYGNPVSPFILSLQDVLFFGRWPDPIDVGYMAVAAFVTLVVGWKVFNRLKRDMALEL